MRKVEGIMEWINSIQVYVQICTKVKLTLSYASQEPIYGERFVTILSAAAWHDKPALGIVTTIDNSINSDVEEICTKKQTLKLRR